eukprot:TRINITY_DN9017_c0_g1_i1.p1 TRINITY_DN9017_c0_g1~~TRINITY_DN9017_c0_g1_i1.p1  ORF type:complete len:794 (-),score=199.57 TRINITY_DN9017_c0_g1_i1:251-2593(-)
MAGEIFQVFGQLKWGPSSGCPPELAKKQITLRCKDGEEMTVSSETACVALRIRSIALYKGCEEPMEFPLTKKTMSKVLEYLKHHASHSVSEIMTPLRGDTLQECGAGRWDASFANVDKDTLYDLTVAATCLEIPSLFFLLSAKAALMTQNRSADKLRKEYGLTNDLSSAEEADLRHEYAASQNRPDADLSQLAASAVQRAGMDAAERKSGVKDLQKTPNSAVNPKSWRQAIWSAAVLEDWKLLGKAPEEVRGNKQLVRGAIMASMGEALKFAAPELQADEEVVLEATSYFGTAFADAAPGLRNDRNFVLKAVAANAAALASAPEEFRGDRLLLRSAAQNGHGAALQGAKASLQGDRALVLEMVTDDAETYKYASEDLKQDRDFALQVVKRNGKALRSVLPKFKADPEIVQAAMTQDPSVAAHAHASRRAEMGVVEKLHGEAQLRQELEAQSQAAALEAGSGQLALSSQHQVQGAVDPREWYTSMKLQKTVFFTAMSSFWGNMGQSNYTAANAVMDKLPGFERPEIDAVGLMWGAVGHIGMRFKAFASMDALNATPEALLTIEDSRMVLQIACCCMDTPEWFNANHFDEFSRSQVLLPTAGKIKFDSSQDTAAETTGNWGDMAGARDKMALQSAASVDRRPLPGAAGFMETDSAPLGGWPSLLGAGTIGATDLPLVPGTRVQLTGLKAKNGVTGVLVQMAGDGKWKVKLDDGSGIALLRSSFLQAIEGGQVFYQNTTGTEKQYKEQSHKYDSAEAEMRRAKIASRRAELKEKLAMRRQAQM